MEEKEITFHKTLKVLRDEKQLSQSALAKILNVDQTAISKYERNIQLPEVRTLVKIASLFNIDVDKLLFGEQHITPNMSCEKQQTIAIESFLEHEDITLTKGGITLSKNEVKACIAVVDAIRDYSN